MKWVTDLGLHSTIFNIYYKTIFIIMLKNIKDTKFLTTYHMNNRSLLINFKSILINQLITSINKNKIRELIFI